MLLQINRDSCKLVKVMVYNTQNSNTKKHRNLKPFVLAAIILLAAGAGTYAYLHYTDAQIAQQEAANKSGRADEIKQNTPAVTENQTNEQPGDVDTPQTSEEVPLSTSATVTISSFAQTNGAVRASAQVSGTGTCVFQYTTDGDKPVVDEVTVSGGVCSSERPEVEFSKLGSWTLKVTYYTNNERVEATQSVTIR